MDKIIISELEVYARVGVTPAERSQRQRLLVNIEMSLDLTAAGRSDRLDQTINYDAVCRRVIRFGQEGEWQLLEKLAADLAEMILKDFSPVALSVEVRKFIIRQAGYVAVRLERAK